MQTPNLQPGTVRQLVRSRNRAVEAFALYRHVTSDEPAPGQFLLESLDTTTQSPMRSFVVSRSCLRIVCRGFEVELSPTNSNGEVIRDALEAAPDALRADDVSLVDGRLLAHYRRAAHDLSDGERLRAPGPLDALRAVQDIMDVEASHPPGFLMVGAFAFDAVDLIEELPTVRDELEAPDFEFFVADRFFVIDHDKTSVRSVANVFCGEDGQASLENYHDAIADMTRMDEQLDTPVFEPLVVSPAREVGVDQSDDDFARHVAIVVEEHVRRGDVFQAVLSRDFTMPCESALASYARLRVSNPSPYMFFAPLLDHQIFGASPETCVRVDAEREVMIKPIAGTRKRGGSSELDERLEVELRLNEKEQAEHMMLVDLARNDVARICQTGTRRVTQLLEVERYSHVMHLVSQVQGLLQDDLDALDAYAACMNMGTLSGAPKVRACELIRKFEASKRGFYGGAIGYLTSEGELDTAIVIRSAVVRDGVAHVRAGAGIVHDSVPEDETRETTQKAMAVLRALGFHGELP